MSATPVRSWERWTRRQDNYLRAHWNDSIQELAKALGRSPYAIQHRRLRFERMKKEDTEPRSRWTSKEDGVLLRYYAREGAKGVAARLKERTPKQVVGRVSFLRRKGFEIGNRPLGRPAEYPQKNHHELSEETELPETNGVVPPLNAELVVHTVQALKVMERCIAALPRDGHTDIERLMAVFREEIGLPVRKLLLNWMEMDEFPSE